MSQVGSVDVKSLFDLCEGDGGVEIIDVRTPDEYAEVRSAFVTKHLPLDQFNPVDLGDKSKTYYFICRSGVRSMKAASVAAEIGYTCVNVEGGTLAWEEQSLPLKHG